MSRYRASRGWRADIVEGVLVASILFAFAIAMKAFMAAGACG